MDFTLKAPAETIVEYWHQLTDENDHNRARIEICGWLLRQLHDANRRGTIEAEHALTDLHKVFSAIETIADEIGHMTNDLMELRYSMTERMIGIVRKISPEVADIIYHSL